jgi:predicted metalloprotease
MAIWDKISSSGNVEDRRSVGPASLGIGGMGLAGVVLVIAINLLGGGEINVNDVLTQLQNSQVSTQSGVDQSEFAGADKYEIFASKVLGSNNDVWREYFASNNLQYQEPTLVLFRGATQSACGGAFSQSGPHYCPEDSTIYLDETFFDELVGQMGAKGGDVAEAYVIAHEVGHHAQKGLGIMDEVQQNNSRENSINLELQADCFAGVWAYSLRDSGVFETNEINEAIDAAGAVGDDRIQKQTSGQVHPETWTHGSSEQRVSWFNAGYNSGRPANCNTCAN